MIKETKLIVDTIDDATPGQYVFAAAEADVVATSVLVYKSPISCPTVAATVTATASSIVAACNQPNQP